MKINNINSNQNFKGIRISKNMPAEIVRAIKSNPVIKKAGKNYSLWFNHSKDPKNNVYITSLSVTTPNIDSFFSLMTTPPHSIKRKWLYLGRRTNGVLRNLEDIEDTPKFFEDLVGTPRTFKQKLKAFIEGWKIGFMSENRTVAEEVKLHKILDKYKNMNMPN